MFPLIPKSFRKRLRTPKEKISRFFRILRYGDSESVSFFDVKTPEGTAFLSPTPLWKKIGILLQSTYSFFRERYATLIREDTALIADSIGSTAPDRYGKFCIGHVFKNAVSFNGCPWSLSVPGIVPDSSGLHLFAGSPKASSRKGLWELNLTANGFKKPLLSKKLAAFPSRWNHFFVPLPKEIVGQKDVCLSFSKTGTSRFYVSMPLLRTKGSHEETALVLILDAVRSKDIGLLGGRNDTPCINHFFSGGIAYDKSYAQSNWTLPAFASMALSQYASEHHVVDPDLYSRTMDRSIPTLAELFRKNGYYTYGSVSHRRCNHALGHHRGFEHFRYAQTVRGKFGSPGEAGPNDVYCQLRELKNYLKNLSGLPFFGFVHLFDTHFPFLENEGHLYDHHLLFPDSINHYVRKSFKKKLPPEEVDQLVQCYMAKLKETDEQLGELFWRLKDRENLTVILTSDHGYSFTSPLGNDLSEEEIQTPFLIRTNRFELHSQKNRVVESSVDLLPTLATLYRLGDRHARSGLPLFDANGNELPKSYALSELVYHNDYRLRFVDRSGGSLLFGTFRDRRQHKIDLGKMRLFDANSSAIPLTELMNRAFHALEKAPFQRELKHRFLELLKKESREELSSTKQKAK